MSNFIAMTKATDKAFASGVDESFREWQIAEWLDNYFGGHEYGIRFKDDPIVRVDNGDFVYNPNMELKEPKL